MLYILAILVSYVVKMLYIFAILVSYIAKKISILAILVSYIGVNVTNFEVAVLSGPFGRLRQNSKATRLMAQKGGKR